MVKLCVEATYLGDPLRKKWSFLYTLQLTALTYILYHSKITRLINPYTYIYIYIYSLFSNAQDKRR